MPAFCRHRCYIAVMSVAITIRNVPDQVRNELASRAAAKGWSLQEFLLTELVELTKRPDRMALLERIEHRLDGTALTASQLTDASDAERR
jgi:plasmid stability protein